MPDDLKGLSIALGFISLGEFATEWKRLSTEEKEQLKADYQVYKVSLPAAA